MLKRVYVEILRCRLLALCGIKSGWIWRVSQSAVGSFHPVDSELAFISNSARLLSAVSWKDA
jgi:hypothetical protein